MTSDIHYLAPQILSAIKDSKNILLHCHLYPDPDSIGSVLAMTAALKQLGKRVTPIMGDSEFPEYFIDIPNKDWFVTKNYSQINPEDYDLFLILDSSGPHMVTQTGDVVFPKTMKTIAIDHHRTNHINADINLIDTLCSSTSELLFQLFSHWKIKIDKDMALQLFLGIFADTGGFKYMNTSPETFRVASELVKINSNYHSLAYAIENHHKALDLEIMGLALSSIEKYSNNQIAFSIFPYELIQQKSLSRDEASEALIPDTLRTVTDWRIVASLVEMSPGEIQVSLRTRYEDDYDVSKIAKAIGEKGGGHRGAAGTTIKQPLDTAKQSLLAIISELYSEFKE